MDFNLFDNYYKCGSEERSRIDARLDSCLVNVSIYAIYKQNRIIRLGATSPQTDTYTQTRQTYKSFLRRGLKILHRCISTRRDKQTTVYNSYFSL